MGSGPAATSHRPRRASCLGGGTLASPADLTGTMNPVYEVLACPFDGDGDVDLIAVEKDRILILSNLGPWSDLGSSLNGSWGPPHLGGDGTLATGDPTALRLDRGRPGGAAWLVMSLFEASLPFKGGTLVPQPDLVVGGLPLSAVGTLDLTFAMQPGAGPGTTFYVQYWIPDPQALYGVAASNGLLGVTP